MKILNICLLLIMATVGCSGQGTANLSSIQTMPDFDSIVASYTTMPNYYIAKYIADIQKGTSEQWQPIEDYELVFYAHGRLVTLESKKKKGFSSALVWIKNDEDSYESVSFDMRLGIRKGTNEFIPIR